MAPTDEKPMTGVLRFFYTYELKTSGLDSRLNIQLQKTAAE
jgi:hypothetical protein